LCLEEEYALIVLPPTVNNYSFQAWLPSAIYPVIESGTGGGVSGFCRPSNPGEDGEVAEAKFQQQLSLLTVFALPQELYHRQH